MRRAPVDQPPPKTPLEQLVKKAKRTAAQDMLGFQFEAAGITRWSEFHWDEPRTRRRSDFFLTNGKIKLLVEVDGGLYVNGGHTRGQARERDYERDAEAMLLGFRVLRVSPRQVKTGKAIGWIVELLK